MKKSCYVLSTCGTSLLVNIAKDTDDLMYDFQYANTKDFNDIPFKQGDMFKRIIDRASRYLASCSIDEARKISAELNGIIGFYSGKTPQNSDFHVLLSTDTWLGEQTAILIETWLNNNKIQASVYRQADLQTNDLSGFQLALSDLIKYFDETLCDYSNKGYKIIFNLTGGFKSVQGFLQSIAHFYADETIYIFERSSELLRIPRLPVKLNFLGEISDNITFFRNVSINIPFRKPDSVSELFLFSIPEKSDDLALSAWGELVWKKSKKEIYSKKLLSSPDKKRIKFSTKFIKTAEKLESDRFELVNERMDDLNAYLFSNKKSNPPRLDFKPVMGKSKLPATHEMDAWSDKDAQRIYGHFEGSCFIVDELAKGLGH